MNRHETREALKGVFEFLRGETKGYQECLKRYINLIGDYSRIYIFGGGIYGFHAASILKKNIPDKEYFFIDNDESKQGKILYDDIRCFGIEKLRECTQENALVIISSIKSRNEIYSLVSSIWNRGIILKDFGFLFCKVDYEDRFQNEIWEEYLEHEIDILNVFDALEDDESCFVFYRIFVNRILMKDTFYEIYTRDQYFIPEISERMGENEVFLDCGSYIGETLESFKRFTNNKFLKTYQFELDINNFRKSSQNPAADDCRVVLMNVGVGERNQTIEYAQFEERGGSCGFAFNEHDLKLGAHLETAEIKSIDSLISDGTIEEKVTFVKADIEGAEMRALKGMEEMIKRDTPKLAICIYHKPQDMWEIPLYIHNTIPSYKLMIRHHGFDDNETVLYAINENQW